MTKVSKLSKVPNLFHLNTLDTSNFSHLVFGFLGNHGEGETPVPIPNTEVKPFSADGTAWVTVWESRTLPRLMIDSPSEKVGFFVSKREGTTQHLSLIHI